MILLIDAGNTRIKLDWMDAGAGQRASQTVAFTLSDPTGLEEWRAQLSKRVVRGVGVNVAGEQAAARLEAMLQCPIEWMQGLPQALGVRNSYLKPVQLGADRWVAMLGLAWHARNRVAVQTATSGAMLAMFGTATTIDTLVPIPVASESNAKTGPDEQAQFDFLGGLILPGPDMMLSSLSTGTANLPPAKGAVAQYPNNTHQAIVTGMAAAQAGAVLRQWMAGLRHNGLPPEVYVSGGGWPVVRKETERLLEQTHEQLHLQSSPIQWLESPVLDGLACLAHVRPSTLC